MTVIARKTEKKAMLMLELAAGIIIMAAAVFVLPISVFSDDPTLLKNGYVWGAVIVGMLFFGLVGLFGFVRPFFLFRKLPQVQAETDGSYLYIYGKKEAKIHLAEMDGTYVNCETPYIMSSEFIAHLFSEQYGTVIIKVPNYGKYKLYYVARAKEVPGMIAALVAGRTC